jgi:hypothetical protein
MIVMMTVRQISPLQLIKIVKMHFKMLFIILNQSFQLSGF